LFEHRALTRKNIIIFIYKKQVFIALSHTLIQQHWLVALSK